MHDHEPRHRCAGRAAVGGQRHRWRRLRRPVPATAADHQDPDPVGSRRRRAARDPGAVEPATPIRHRESLTSASEEVRMDHRQAGIMGPDERAPSRRDFLKAAGVGVAGTMVAGAVVGGLGRGARPASAATQTLSLIATDGYATMPNREDNPLYIFGFRDVTTDPDQSVSHLVATYKGHAQMSAPTLDFLQDDINHTNDIKITLTNMGLVQRPDLTDSHTIHWHGFDIPSPLNDGVPEVSVAVPIGK